MYYKINGEDEIYTDIDSVIEYCIDSDYHWDDEYFEEWINDCYDYIEIRGVRFEAYDILRNMDEYLLDDLRKEYCQAENENDECNARYELENADAGDEIYIQGQIVKCFEASGNYDGDKELQDDRKQISSKAIEDVKAYLAEQKEQETKYAAAEKEKEDELLKVFQVIS